jgi:hypothetical protein
MIHNEQQNLEILDDEGYLTDTALEIIENWDMFKKGTEELLAFISDIWYFGDWGFKREGDKLELHTGGWSGNELVIRHLQKNFFWTFFWESSRRGGHYYFDGIKELKKEE